MKLTAKVISMLVIMLVIVMVPAVLLVWQNQQRSIILQARTRALTLHQMIVITRQWVAENRGRIEPVPAAATKELSAYAKYMADFRFHITSDILVNTDNAPDEFEMRAISHLRSGETEYAEKSKVEGLGNVYRYAAPLEINEHCLPCHGFQGYKIEDFRGLISIMIPLSETEAAVRSSNTALIAAIITGFVLTIFTLSQLLYRFVLSPIRVLTEAVENMESGNYNITTNLNTNDEIQQLSRAFDTMSVQIARNQENLKAKLEEAVHKYIDIVEELQEKNKQLDTINQLKTDLLDSVSHEVRTPLTKVMSYTELMVDPRLNDDEKREYLAKQLKTNVAIIAQMFTDIITMSRLEHGQYTYHKIPLALKEMIITLLEQHDKEIKECNLNIVLNIDSDLRLIVDGESFYFLMSNVLSNAVKYSKPSTSIEISACKTDNSTIIICKDHGVGIPKNEISAVTGRFVRATNVKNSYKGTGLGLAIVSRIVEAHCGTLTIESELNEYTKVIIEIPDENIPDSVIP